MFSDILTTVQTIEDQKLLLTEIDLLLNSMYRLGDNAFEPTLAKEVRKTTANEITQLVQSVGGDKERLLKDLRKEVASLSVLSLELAYEPSSESIQQIYEWTAKHLSPGFVLSFSVNSEIVAGASISYKGKFHNGSLKDKVIKALK